MIRPKQRGMIQGHRVRSVIRAGHGFCGRGYDLTGVQVSSASPALVPVRLLGALEGRQAEA